MKFIQNILYINKCCETVKILIFVYKIIFKLKLCFKLNIQVETMLLYIWYYAIALVQESWLVRNGIKGLSVTVRVYPSGEHVGQRACVVERGLEATLMQEFSTRDLAVVRIRGKDGVNRGKEFIVASAYCAHDKKPLDPESSSGVTSWRQGGRK